MVDAATWISWVAASGTFAMAIATAWMAVEARSQAKTSRRQFDWILDRETAAAIHVPVRKALTSLVEFLGDGTGQRFHAWREAQDEHPHLVAGLPTRLRDQLDQVAATATALESHERIAFRKGTNFLEELAQPFKDKINQSGAKDVYFRVLWDRVGAQHVQWRDIWLSGNDVTTGLRRTLNLEPAEKGRLEVWVSSWLLGGPSEALGLLEALYARLERDSDAVAWRASALQLRDQAQNAIDQIDAVIAAR